MNYYIYGLTDKGNCRSHNEDSILIDHEVVTDGCFESTVSAPFLSAVCDGVGGEKGGEIASELCLRHLSILDFNMGINIKKEIMDIHRKIKKSGVNSENSVNANMQTTLCMLTIDEDGKANCINVGDSRMYRYVNGTIHRISVDQSYARYLYEHGKIDDTEHIDAKYKNAIVSSIGSTLNEPEIADTPLVSTFGKEPDDMILLMTDGISDHVEEAEIEIGLGLDLPVSKKLGAIAELALTNGSTDNVSIIGIKPYETEHELHALTSTEPKEKTVSVEEILAAEKRNSTPKNAAVKAIESFSGSIAELTRATIDRANEHPSIIKEPQQSTTASVTAEPIKAKQPISPTQSQNVSPSKIITEVKNATENVDNKDSHTDSKVALKPTQPTTEEPTVAQELEKLAADSLAFLSDLSKK